MYHINTDLLIMCYKRDMISLKSFKAADTRNNDRSGFQDIFGI